MPYGPGKYDKECMAAMATTEASTVVLVVLGGTLGHGFSVVSVDPKISRKLPGLLRQLADNIEDHGPPVSQ